MSAGSFDAFDSPNLPPLVTMKVKIEGKSFKLVRTIIIIIAINNIWRTFYLKFTFNLFVFLAVQWDAIFRSNNGSKFTVHTNMNPNIGLLRLFPGITAETVSDIGILVIFVLSLIKIMCVRKLISLDLITSIWASVSLRCLCHLFNRCVHS